MSDKVIRCTICNRFVVDFGKKLSCGHTKKELKS